MTPLDDLLTRKDGLLDREGGVADVGDGKGVTRFGQTSAWLEQFGLPIPTNRSEAAANYVRWIEVTKLDLVLMTVDSLSDIVLDIAVMSDHRKAWKALQHELGVTVDGVPGKETIAALLSADRRQLARGVLAWDMEYQGSIITLNPQRAMYAKEWARRMAWHVRRLV